MQAKKQNIHYSLVKQLKKTAFQLDFPGNFYLKDFFMWFTLNFCLRCSDTKWLKNSLNKHFLEVYLLPIFLRTNSGSVRWARATSAGGMVHTGAWKTVLAACPGSCLTLVDGNTMLGVKLKIATFEHEWNCEREDVVWNISILSMRH